MLFPSWKSVDFYSGAKLKTFKKKTIVFVSEMGEGLGHVSRLLQLAENLQKQDFNCIFLVSDLLRAGAKVQQSGFNVIAAPNIGLSPLKPGQQTTSMADIYEKGIL